MKQEIMIKLFNDKELSGEEITFIGRNLPACGEVTIPFDHGNESCLAACGLVETDVDDANKQFTELLKEINETSQIIEKIESIALSNQKMMRMIIFQAVQASAERHNKQRDLGGMDLSGYTKDIQKTLDKLIKKLRKDMDDLK